MPGPPLLYNSWDTQNDTAVAALARSLLSASLPLAYSNVTGQFSIANAAADGATKGAAAFTAADFNDNGAGLISLDYTNGQKATAGQPGFLTSTDWTTFNAKQNAITLGNFTEVTSSILTISGGTGAIIGTGLTVAVAQSGAATSGYLSTTDWNTFNGKQAALSLPLSIANGGTNNAGPFTAGSVIFSNGTLLTQDNSKLFWNDTAFSLCVGTVTQVAALTVVAQTAGQAGCSILAANAAAVASALGGAITLLSGIGGSPATGLGGIGGTVTISSGAGGTSTNNSGGNGGAFSFQSGAGGASTRPTGLNNAKGGAFLMAAGAGGAASIGGAGGGGTFTIGSGAGGISNGTGAGGLAGVMAISGGIGGANTGTGNGGGGAGIQLTGGTGGSTPAAAGTPGAGGSVLLTGGSAGASGDNVLGNTGGSVTLVPGAGTGSAPVAGKIVFGNAAAQIVNFVAGSGAAAPSTSVGVAIVNYYGSSATNFLGTPSAWLSIQAGGVTYRLPLYV
jgi:hypothetical protein